MSHPRRFCRSAQDAEEKVQGRGESGGEGPRTEERRPGPQQPSGPPGPAGVHAGHALVSESTYGPRKRSTAGTEDHLRLGGSLSPAAALAAVPSLRARSSGQPQLSRPLVRPALGLGNVRVRSQVAGRSRRPAWAPEAAVSLSREALGVAAPRVSQIGVLGPCRWGRAIGGGTLPSPSPIPQRPGLGGTRTQAGLRTGLGDIGGLPGAGPTAVGWPSL